MAVELVTGMYAEERGSISGILDALRDHSNTIETFREDHSGQAASIEKKAQETFLNQYMVSSFIFGRTVHGRLLWHMTCY